MEENLEDMDKFLGDTTRLLLQCKKHSVELSAMMAECNHSMLMNMVSKTGRILDSITGGIYEFYNVQVPNTALTSRDKMKLLTNCNDSLLDKLAIDMQAASAKKPSDIDEITSSMLQKNSNQKVKLTTRKIDKPQLSFTVKIDNSADTPFMPILTEKPNSKKPLAIMLCVDEGEREYYNHPYSYELLHFSTPPHQLESTIPVDPLVFEETPYIFVNTVKDLQNAVKELSICKEIAVDLEHHSFRSYQGLTCLLQISSRSKDYIVDTLQLRGQLECLNEVFTNPKIIKVFHGACNDILWLQRDLGVYVVNMFDTYQAAVLLEYPTKSLAHLLKIFCDVTVNKVYQRADWRIRPLPNDFVYYARQDTHYLLYIFDKMRNELIEKDNSNLIHIVYDRSTDVCLERYEKPYVDEESHMDLYSRSRVMFNSRQRYALKKLFQWRDETARKEDESSEYTFPAHMMFQVSEHLPKEVQSLYAHCHPIPVNVKAYHLVLHHIILEALKLPLKEVEKILHYQKPEKPVHNFELKMDLTSKFDFSRTEINPVGLSSIFNESFEPNESYKYRLNKDDKISLKTKSDFFGSVVKIGKEPIKKVECTFRTPVQRHDAMFKIQELLDETRQNSTSNESRVAEVLNFLSNMKQPEMNTSMEEGEDSDHNSTQDLTSEPQQPQAKASKEPRGKKSTLKRVLTENKWKLLHDGEELPENFEEVGKEKRLKRETEVPVDFKSFDYSQADTSFLKAPKMDKREKIHEKFKAKRSQNVTGLKKSGLKSFSWGTT